MTRVVVEQPVFVHYDNGSRSQQTVTVKNLLEPFKGYFQNDGYSVYNIFEDKAVVRLVACLIHIRRRYKTALEENCSLTEHALKEIQALYQIEHMVRLRRAVFPGTCRPTRETGYTYL